MELKSKNFYFFLFFLLFSMFAEQANAFHKLLKKPKVISKVTLKVKSRFHYFNSTKYSSFVIQAPRWKSTATINFNLKKTDKITSLGIINQHFALFSHNITHLIYKKGKTILHGRRIMTNKFNSRGQVLYKNISQW